MLSVPRLRVLREVVQRGSFSEAAAALSYTQSAVSQAVAALEREAGATLLQRDRRGVRPTPVGALLVSHADAILGRLEAAEADLAAVLGLRGGLLRMACFPSAGAALMPPAIAAFRAAHPDVELSLAEDEPDAIVPRLRAGELDLALLYEFHGVSEKLGAGLRRIELFEDPLYVALAANHPLAAKSQLALADLHGEPWIQTSAATPCAQHVVRCCHAAGFEPTVSFESDDYQTVQGLVAAGVGVALIPQLALAPAREDVVVRDLRPHGPVRRVVAATARSAEVAPPAAAMLDVLRTVAQGWPAVRAG
ncbi:MAG TPA: LysR family transcriptional regulator [Conexibacter sp.]|jgi:DNA-binding transcriptional LysR family regulator|nr:LysR family transcriptional regulator [Conexibacter sp.]